MNIDCQIERQVCVLSETPKGWTKELNLAVWNGRFVKYDIRTWDSTHQPKGGITLTLNELQKLYEAIGEEIARRKGEPL